MSNQMSDQHPAAQPQEPPIDAVISWVDGNDPTYQQKLTAFCQQQGIEKNTAVEPTRIQQRNEIYYCLHSLKRFAPWIRYIYILTNQQVPAVVNEFQGDVFAEKIKIIDQNELLAQTNSQTPIFNSLSVEWLMWRIPGLSDHFIYLNDDFFITGDVSPNDFFWDNHIVLRGDWKTPSDQKWFSGWFKGNQAENNPHRHWQEQSAALAGSNQSFFSLEHAPYALRKSTFDNYIAQDPALFTKNSQYPFRHKDQISSIPLITHLDIRANRVVYEKRSQTIMVNGETHSFGKIKKRLKEAANNQRIIFVCMQSIDQAPASTQKYMLQWLNDRIMS